MILDDIAQETRRRIGELKKEGYYDEIHRKIKDFIPKKSTSSIKTFPNPVFPSSAN